MRTLVTGGAGYVGGTVATLLAVQGHETTVFDNLCHARRGMVPAGMWISSKATWRIVV